MLEQFDDNTLDIIKKSFEYTTKHYKLSKVGTESILYIMFKEEDSICNFLLEDYRVREEEIKDIISRYVLIRSNNQEYTDKFLEVIEMARAISKENNSSLVKEEHLLYALLVVKDTIFEDTIIKLNLNQGALIEDLKAYFNLKNNNEVESYSVSLTQLAKDKKLNKMIGREEYLERMKIVLGRKNKNNILLIGSAGVGKTALVEGLCYDLLETLSEYNVISLNISSLIANTKYRGDFEARINKVLDEVIERENSIVFIDEIHTIVGAGSSDNLLDVANIIKPYLVRNNFRCIGATTAEEYQKTIMKDKALARRFQPIFVNELNEEETLNVLIGIKDDYIKYHNVEVSDIFMTYIIKLCKEKIVSRKFPDKAIDLLDEAMCIAKMRSESKLKMTHIDDALKNITGAQNGDLDYDYKYQELQPYFLDNFLGIKNNKNLVSIAFNGDDENLKLLLEELKLGFGIGSEMVLELNLTNYTDLHSLSSLIGTPPGYVGYDDGGILSEHFAKFLYQIIVIHKFESASYDIKEFLLSMKDKGVFYDKKGREFLTYNTVLVFVTENKDDHKIGFLNNNIKVNEGVICDLYLTNKNDFVFSNPYISSFKYKGFDLSFDENEFSHHILDYKKSFFELLKKYEKGKYVLKYNDFTKKIDILVD